MDYLYLLLIPVMSILARMSGGGLGADKIWGRLPELLFALVFSLASFKLYGVWWVSVLFFIESYFAMEMGHGTFYEMKGYVYSEVNGKPRKQLIEYFVRPFYFGNIEDPLYSWVCMAVKGFLIALPLGLLSPINAIMWPLSYWIGVKIIKNIEYGEWFSGGLSGFLIAVSLLICR